MYISLIHKILFGTFIFLGVVAMMSQQCLILFAVFAESSQEAGESAGEADKAAAAFLFVLFVVYGIFGVLLGTFRNKILQEDSEGEVENNISQTL